MSEPIITFNNRTLRVEHDGWYLEVKVLAASTQIAVTASGDRDGCGDMIIRPGRSNMVFISSRASERTEPDGETTTTATTKQAQPDSGNRRPAKR